jgi:hypothetical protein
LDRLAAKCNRHLSNKACHWQITKAVKGNGLSIVKSQAALNQDNLSNEIQDCGNIRDLLLPGFLQAFD